MVNVRYPDYRSTCSLTGYITGIASVEIPPDGLPLTVDDLDPEFLFGNNVAVGCVGLKDGSGIGATILVVDSYYEDAVKAKLDDIRVVLLD